MAIVTFKLPSLRTHILLQGSEAQTVENAVSAVTGWHHLLVITTHSASATGQRTATEDTKPPASRELSKCPLVTTEFLRGINGTPLFPFQQ